MGYIPSFCTACYRAGRQGERFMEVCKAEQISAFCHPNALMTLMEYLIDYASPAVRAAGEALVRRELESPAIMQSKMYDRLLRNMDAIENGVRDLRF